MSATVRAHEAGWAHAAVSVRGPAWLRDPADVNALVPQLWSGTARKVDGVLEVGGVLVTDLVREHFDLRPAALVQALDLRRPIYRPTAAYGHFGRDEPGFTWERTDTAAALRSAANLH